MSRRMGVSKNDGHATALWGHDVYKAIPKSVFATAAWHLANIASGEVDHGGAAELRFCEELKALAQNGIIPPKQVIASVTAIAELKGRT